MAVAVVQRIIQLNSGHVQGVRRWWLAASGVAAATTTGLRRKKSTTTAATGTDPTEGTAAAGGGQGAAGGAGFGGAADAASGAAGFGGGFPGMGGGIGDAGGGTGSSGDGAGGADAEDVRKTILEAALPFVHQVGWSREALSMGAEAAGYPGVAHGIFTGGGAELVLYFIASCNARLEDALRASPLPPAPPPEERARFVQAAVRQRLEMVAPFVNRWPQALALQANPRHAPSALALLLTMVDDICFFAGDRDVDFSWYTHRITLAGIYKATELYMIQDKSEEYQKTWNFLGRCIDDSTTMQKYLQQSKGTQIANETITAAFVTARNILGLNTAR